MMELFANIINDSVYTKKLHHRRLTGFQTPLNEDTRITSLYSKDRNLQKLTKGLVIFGRMT